MKLSEAQHKVLLVLDNIPAGPGYIGNRVWGNGYRKPQSYARTAGKVLNALREKFLVIWFPGSAGMLEGWILTRAGARVKAGLKEVR